MKSSKTLTFIIGMLTGAIIMTLVFLFITPGNGGGNVPPGGFGGQPPEMPNGGMQPPQMPNGAMQQNAQ